MRKEGGPVREEGGGDLRCSPVGVGDREEELPLDYESVLIQHLVLDTSDVIGCVGTTDIHLEHRNGIVELCKISRDMSTWS